MTNTPDLIRMLEDVYLPGFEQSMQRVLDARQEVKADTAPPARVLAIPLFESMSWAFAMVEGLEKLARPDKKFRWIKTPADRKFVKAFLFAANETKHNLLNVVDISQATFIMSSWNMYAPAMMAATVEWTWRPSLVSSGSKDSRNPGYMSELGGELIHKSLIKLGPIFADGIQKFSNVSKT